MLPHVEDLLEGFALYAHRQQVPATHDARAVGAALVEAAELADGSERDEAAAIFFALARRPRAFGKLQREMVMHMAVEQARATGYELKFEPVELQIHEIRILRQEMPFAELRGWFSARLALIERRPWPR